MIRPRPACCSGFTASCSCRNIQSIIPVTLVLATRNRHKAAEIQQILGSRFACVTLEEFPGAPEVEEGEATFAANATKKAVELASWLAGQPVAGYARQEREPRFVLADDSGLEVDALDGAPGVISARFARSDSLPRAGTPDENNNAKLLGLLRDVPCERRSARFRSVLALTPLEWPRERFNSPVCAANELELMTELFAGTCEGRIGFEPRGQGGFGYDPLFIPNGFEQSLAELGAEIKNKISHRAAALKL